jgi:hypothetical protein
LLSTAESSSSPVGPRLDYGDFRGARPLGKTRKWTDPVYARDRLVFHPDVALGGTRSHRSHCSVQSGYVISLMFEAPCPEMLANMTEPDPRAELPPVNWNELDVGELPTGTVTLCSPMSRAPRGYGRPTPMR